MKLSPNELITNYNTLLDKLKLTFSGERLDNLLKMYSHFEDRMVVAPASGRLWWHNAFVGGYVLHVLHVIDNAEKLFQLYVNGGGTENFTYEELVFAAAHHDLGKVGDLTNEYYIPNTSEWHIKHRQEVFVHNPKLNYMTVTDRGLWLLQHFGLKLTLNESMAIQLSDGLFEESNGKYYVNRTFRDENQLTNNLCYIIHWADWISTRQEYDTWKRNSIKMKEKINSLNTNIPTVTKSTEIKSTDNIFDEIFNTKSVSNKGEK